MGAIEKALRGISHAVQDWAAIDKDENGRLVLEVLAERWHPKGGNATILEVGTCRCIGASILAQFGTVYTVDALQYDGTQAVLKAFGADDKVVRIAGPQDKARALVAGMCFDFAFLDAWHAYQPVLDDFAFLRTVTSRIIFHDYQPRFEGAMKAMDEIKSNVGGDWHYASKFAVWDGTNGN